MKKIHKKFCIPFIIICITSILFMYHISCTSETCTIESPIIIEILAFTTIMVGIFTDSTYIIREKIAKRVSK